MQGRYPYDAGKACADLLAQSYHATYQLPVVDAASWEKDGATHMVILAWNFQDEIITQMRPFAQAGGRFVIPIPSPRIVGGG